MYLVGEQAMLVQPGTGEGISLIERIPNLQAVIVIAKNEVLVSSGLKNRFAMPSKPKN